MRFIYTKRNIDLSPDIRDDMEKKLSKLDKFFQESTQVHVTVSMIKSTVNLEITIPHKDIIFRAEVKESDVLIATDRSVDILVRQIRKNKTRLEKRLRANAFSNMEMQEDLSKESDEELEYNVVRTKRFAMKPMTVEEAILQMNLLGHQFFMFKNADTNEANVVYVRKDNNYGLIEPEV